MCKFQVLAMLLAQLPATMYAQCNPPTALSPDAPNVLLIGDSISMGSTGYSLFVQDILQTASGGTLVGSLQHGGGFDGGGQMASSDNGAEKVRHCMGNATGTLKPQAWSVITYNAGLHDCDTTERVLPTKYAANLRAVFETLKPAASATVFVMTTPYPVPLHDPHPAGINMSCVIEYNAIARKVATEAGAVIIDDLYGYTEDFCQAWPLDPAASGYGGNYTNCAIQTPSTLLHYFTHAPLPSGQQYTALSVAEAVIRLIPNAQIQNKSGNSPPSLSAPLSPLSCGNPPAPLKKNVPNVLMIGDSISMPGYGYGPLVQRILEHPRPGQNNQYQTGALASVQHSGGNGSTQAGPTTNGAACVEKWVGTEKWDVITVNFGIHDCCPGSDGRPAGQIVHKEDYVKNLETIYNVLHQSLARNGKILWVTTTPISKGAAATNCGNGTGYDFPSCIDTYNEAAAALFTNKPDVEIVDLHSAVLDVCGQHYEECNLQLHSNVHFTEAGKQFCAVKVAKGIAPFLGAKWAELAPNPVLALGEVYKPYDLYPSETMTTVYM